MEFINAVKSKEKGKIDDALKSFLNANANSFIFDELYDFSVQKETWDLIISLLENHAFDDVHLRCLQVLKILSRDKQHLNSILNEQIICSLLSQANLNPKEHSKCNNSQQEFERIVESQKCIFNLIFNNTKCHTMFLNGFILEGILARISENNDVLPHEVKLFDLQILFLLSALSPKCRPRFRYTLKGVHHMIILLDRFLKDTANDEDVQYCNEALKIIFNLLTVSKKPEIDEFPQYHTELFTLNYEDESEQFHHLIFIIRTCLLSKSNSSKVNEMKSHAINLLTAINSEYYADLHMVMYSKVFHSQQANQSQEMDLTIPKILLQFLDDHLELPNQLLDKLLPILTVITEYSRKYNIMRKFFRVQILPPLRDVTHRPEEGNTLRNKLCRLMTCAVTHIQTLVAELIFVLCKENVGRLIKYTGYGNAAGLLANRGLMLSRQDLSQYERESDSEDSETEEYIELEDKINPVTGCLDIPKPNPMEGMTEEQKEYEAVRLINLMDRLQREGIIQPARIGDDGKPHAVEHVLQLQEGIGLPDSEKKDTANTAD